MSYTSHATVIGFFACSLMLFSCAPAVEKVTINKEYSMEIPKHMVSTNELNDDASLQYKDTSIDAEEYVIVIDESKKEFVTNFETDSVFSKVYDKNASAEKNYRAVELASMKDRMETKSGPNIKKATINGLDAEIVDFVATPENLESFIYYKVAFIEGKDKLYMVMAWTLAETKDKYDAEMEKMLNSFSLAK